MTTKVLDIDGHRTLEIDGNSAHRPGSVFLQVDDFCIEIDKVALHNAFMLETAGFDHLIRHSITSFERMMRGEPRQVA